MTTTSLKGKITTTFPARVSAVHPLLLNQSNGNYTLSLDGTYLEELVPASTFIGLEDVDPSSFSGQAGKLVSVNVGETGLEFTTPSLEDPYVVNVKDHGAVGDGVADDAAAIQTAIDYAFANGFRLVFIPDGTYNISEPLYLDPPTNLRVNFSSPPLFAFSISLVGNEGLNNDTADGVTIAPQYSDDAGIYVGTGNGMLVKNLQIIFPGGSYHRNHHPDGVGIAICGASGGASRVRIENVGVYNVYTAFQTGTNGNNLADSNTFIKCFAYNCAEAYWFKETQNFINSLYECQISHANVGVRADVGTGANIYGGNWSPGPSVANSFNISSISALSAVVVGSYRKYQFSATIASPDAYWNTDTNRAVYNAFTFVTTHYGIVPCTLVSFTGSVATFLTQDTWSQYYWGGNNALSVSELQSAIQACTKVFAAEICTAFLGNNITAQGIHVESPNSPICLFNTFAGFGSNRPSTLKNCFMNFDASLESNAPSHAPGDAGLAKYYAMKTFPLINAYFDLHISDCEFGLSDVVLVDVYYQAYFQVDRVRNFFHNVRTRSSAEYFGPAEPTQAYYSQGLYDRLYFAGNFNLTYDALWRTTRGGATPSLGVRPAPWVTPSITVADYATLGGALPAISSASVNYPLLWGGQIYGVQAAFHDNTGADYGKRFYSPHNFYSYGQNLGATQIGAGGWSYRGKSFVVYVEDQSMLFPGLGIILNDGGSDIEYLVTGVFPGLGYITVIAEAGLPHQNLTSGLLSATITGNTIKQTAYTLTVT